MSTEQPARTPEFYYSHVIRIANELQALIKTRVDAIPEVTDRQRYLLACRTILIVFTDHFGMTIHAANKLMDNTAMEEVLRD